MRRLTRVIRYTWTAKVQTTVQYGTVQNCTVLWNAPCTRVRMWLDGES